MAAVVSAARVRPSAPSRNTSRRSRCRPRGVTTATETAVSPVPRDRPNGHTDIAATELPSAIGEPLERVGDPIVVDLVAVGRAVRQGSGCVGGERLVEAEPGHVAEQRVELASRPDLDDRQRPAERLEPCPDGVGPRRLAGRPDVGTDRVEDHRRGGLDESRRPRSCRPRRPRSGRRRPRHGRRSRRSGSVARSSASPSRSATCDSPIPVSRYVRDATSRPEAGRLEARQRMIGPHRPHLAWRTGQGDDDPAGPMAHEPPRCGPVRVRQRLRRRDEPGLLEVQLRERACRGASRARAARPRAPGRPSGVSPQTAAMASRVRSSGVGPRPPVETTRSRARPARRRTPRVTSSSRSGTAVSRTTSTPCAVRARASSPAFVSRVSPTVSSLPMLRRLAVRIGRASAGRAFGSGIGGA